VATVQAALASVERARPNTTLEWPSENQKPPDNDRVPSPTSLRVVLSITASNSRSERDVLRHHTEHQNSPPNR
jgi:hypothetical protein